jgi:enamine deaminase RidA (YjgF/YER057c/UK114 family)
VKQVSPNPPATHAQMDPFFRKAAWQEGSAHLPLPQRYSHKELNTGEGSGQVNVDRRKMSNGASQRGRVATLTNHRKVKPMKAILPLVTCLCSVLGSYDLAAQQKTSIQRVDAEAKLKRLGIELPEPPKPVANYVGAVRTGNLIFLAGAGPRRDDGSYMTGRLGQDLAIEQGYQAARQTGIIQLAVLKAELGDLNKVKRIVKVLGMVNSAPSFTEQPKVVNGFSDLMVEVFGDRGKHARSAVGMVALPMNIAVEVEMVVEVEGK